MITKRTLEKWRREALLKKQDESNTPAEDDFADWVIKLTRILLDQHLLSKLPGSP